MEFDAWTRKTEGQAATPSIGREGKEQGTETMTKMEVDNEMRKHCWKAVMMYDDDNVNDAGCRRQCLLLNAATFHPAMPLLNATNTRLGYEMTKDGCERRNHSTGQDD